MQFLRKWTLPDLVIHRYEEGDHPVGWGFSIFWYCSNCAKQYAFAELFGELLDDEGPTYHPPWRAVAGLCLDCPSNRFSIAGTLEAGYIIGWPVPLEVAHYQLSREIAFLDHPDHPHNKGN